MDGYTPMLPVYGAAPVPPMLPTNAASPASRDETGEVVLSCIGVDQLGHPDPVDRSILLLHRLEGPDDTGTGRKFIRPQFRGDEQSLIDIEPGRSSFREPAYPTAGSGAVQRSTAGTGRSVRVDHSHLIERIVRSQRTDQQIDVGPRRGATDRLLDPRASCTSMPNEDSLDPLVLGRGSEMVC